VFASDRAGMLLSLLCVSHCAATPFVLAYLPMLGLTWLADERIHVVLAATAAVLAGTSFVPGFLRHGYLAAPLLGAAGLGLLFLSASTADAACPCCRRAPEAVRHAPHHGPARDPRRHHARQSRLNIVTLLVRLSEEQLALLMSTACMSTACGSSTQSYRA